MYPSALFARRATGDILNIHAVAATTSDGRFTWGGIDLSWHSSRVGGAKINFEKVLPAGLRERTLLATDGVTPELIEILSADRDRLNTHIADGGADPTKVIALIEPHDRYNGILVPRRLASPSQQGDCPMSRLDQDAPLAFARLKALCDDDGPINEVLIYGFNKVQKTLSQYYDVRGSKTARPKSLTDAELQDFSNGYAKSVAKRHYSKISDPEIRPLDDVTLAIQPLAAQDETNNVILFLAVVSLGRHDILVHMAFDEHLAAVSADLLKAFGRTKQAANAVQTAETRAVN
jgi:hypothetical protein